MNRRFQMCTNAQGELVLSCTRLRSAYSCGWSIAISHSAKRIAMEPVATYSGDPTILTLVNWGTGLILIGRDGRSESTVNRISRFVFALPTRERLEAKSSPQMAPTFSEQNGPAVR